MQRVPSLYTRRLFGHAFIIWGLLRLSIVFLAIQADLPEPAHLPPSATVLLIGLVPAVTWFDLRRRNLLALLPNFGVSIPSALAIVTAVAAVAELILRVVL